MEMPRTLHLRCSRAREAISILPGEEGILEHARKMEDSFHRRHETPDLGDRGGELVASRNIGAENPNVGLHRVESIEHLERRLRRWASSNQRDITDPFVGQPRREPKAEAA